jgi:DNA-binding winged helix-turn-helix (wHTH) protein/tetratricopeptide (TPR) repeat protein
VSCHLKWHFSETRRIAIARDISATGHLIMMKSNRLCFGLFQMDLTTNELRKDTDLMQLLPKDAAVLSLLVRNSGSLVTKKALLDTVWQGVNVSDDVLKTSIKRLRKILADDFRAPQFIETVHRRGYRFIAPVHHQSSLKSGGEIVAATALFGRGDELQFMQSLLGSVDAGETHLVAIRGEAGIGKSTLIEGFVNQCLDPEAVTVASGQCVSQLGQSEPYRPILEALGRMCRSASKDHWIRILRQFGPMWLCQMPWLCEPTELDELKQMIAGATPTRMLRELALVMEMGTRDRPLVLVIEDLHWSDSATLDAINLIVRCGSSAKVLLCASFRNPQVGNRYPRLNGLMNELFTLSNCHLLTLRPLDLEDVEMVLASKFGYRSLPDDLIAWLYTHSEGNPLFLNLLTAHVTDLGWLKVEERLRWQPRSNLETSKVVPTSLRRLIQRYLDQLEPSERLSTETASVCGMTFTARHIKAVLEKDELRLEHLLEGLAKRRLLIKRAGVFHWPDGRMSQKYCFVHALYQKHLYDQVPAARRQASHQRVGEMLENVFSGNHRHIIGALATHFEKGLDKGKASEYRFMASKIAFEKHAYEAVIVNVKRGIGLIEEIPEGGFDLDTKVALYVNLAKALLATRGYGAPGLLDAYERAYQLSRHRIEPSKTLPILFGIYAYHHVRSNTKKSLAMCEDFHKISSKAEEPGYTVWASFMWCSHHLYRGNFEQALAAADKGVAIYKPEKHQELVALFGVDAGLDCMAHRVWTYWFLGYPDRACQAADEALETARAYANPLMVASVTAYKTVLYLLLNDVEKTSAHADELINFCEEKGIFYWYNLAMAIQGWAMAHQGQISAGAHRIKQFLQAHRASGSVLGQTKLLTLLADILLLANKHGEALAHIDEALDIIETADTKLWLGEALVVKAKIYQALALQADQSKEKKKHEDDSEKCLQAALTVARSQKALSLELRVGIEIAKRLTRADDGKAVFDLLDPIMNQFTEGFDTRDWNCAKSILGDIAEVINAPN